MPELVLALPGDPETITGGYGYDRRIVVELAAAGWRTSILRLSDDFPVPAKESLETALNSLAAAPADAALLIDGLAFSALPADRLAALGRPVIALIHHPLSLETGLAPAEVARIAAGERAAFAVADAIVVTSPATARTLIADFAVPEERITVALPGTDPIPQALSIWQAPSIPEAHGASPPAILAVGSIVPRKGHDVLVAALDAIRDRPWTCRIAGGLDHDPACAAALSADIAARGLADRIALVGAVDRARLLALYGEADVFALLSAYEGYGMAFAEALAAGLPIVGCDGGAVAETVPPEAGILVAPGDAPAAAAALARLLDDPACRRRMAAAALAAGARLPSWSETAATIAGVLSRTLTS